MPERVGSPSRQIQEHPLCVRRPERRVDGDDERSLRAPPPGRRPTEHAPPDSSSLGQGTSSAPQPHTQMSQISNTLQSSPMRGAGVEPAKSPGTQPGGFTNLPIPARMRRAGIEPAKSLGSEPSGFTNLPTSARTRVFGLAPCGHDRGSLSSVVRSPGRESYVGVRPRRATRSIAPGRSRVRSGAQTGTWVAIVFTT